MSMPPERQRVPIDTVIDDAARSLTEGEPGPWFVEQVRQRLTGNDAPRLTMKRIAAAAVAMVLTVVLVWWNVRDDRSPRLVEGTPAGNASSLVPPLSTVSPPVETSRPRVDDGARSGPDLARRARGTAQLDSAGPPALASARVDLIIDPLVIERLEPSMVAVDAIPSPEPLRVERLAMEPLSIQ
jgi:hypothetical protein